MSGPIVVLLPPSEGKAEGGEEPWDPAAGEFGSLARQRRAVAKALNAEMRRPADEISRLLGVNGDQLKRALKTNRAATRKPPALPAHKRFTGIVHDHLDLVTLGDQPVVFFNALCGVVAPGDPVPDHRLKMSVSLGALKKLSTWWRPHVDRALEPVLHGAVVIDLLPNEHAAAMTPRPDRWKGWWRALFEDVEADGRKIIGHDAKAAKGLFARHVLEAGDVSPDVIDGFSGGGFTLERIEPSTDGGPTIAVFSRPR